MFTAMAFAEVVVLCLLDPHFRPRPLHMAEICNIEGLLDLQYNLNIT